MGVLTITSRKGGCGKTMLATVLAASLADGGADVALLDADPNGSAHRWTTSTYTGQAIPSYAEADAERLAELLPTLTERHAILIVDTAGFGNQAAMVAAAGADLVLVPVTPGEGDLVEAQRTVAYVEGLARSTRRAIPARWLLTKSGAPPRCRATCWPRLISSISPPAGSPKRSGRVRGDQISGVLPKEGGAAEEIAALVTEMREAGWLPMDSRKVGNLDTRKGVKA